MTPDPRVAWLLAHRTAGWTTDRHRRRLEARTAGELGDGRLLHVIADHAIARVLALGSDATGGFVEDADWRWSPVRGSTRLLEFQARQVRTLALACRLRPTDEALRTACERGFRHLADVMWDEVHGGFYLSTAVEGAATDDGAKHTHGTAYALQACTEVGDILGLEDARRLADETFQWLDRHAWDHANGGYWGPMRRDGSPTALAGSTRPVDHIGTPIGAKDLNVNGDMIEALTAYATSGAPSAGTATERIAQLVARFFGLYSTHGALPTVLDARFDALADTINAGYQFQNVHRLVATRSLLGRSSTNDAVLTGIYDVGQSARGRFGGVADPAGDEQWWIQLERMRAAATLAADLGSADHVAETIAAWNQLCRRHLDRRAGGFTALPAPAGLCLAKSTRWKDCSHETAALLATHRCATGGAWPG